MQAAQASSFFDRHRAGTAGYPGACLLVAVLALLLGAVPGGKAAQAGEAGSTRSWCAQAQLWSMPCMEKRGRERSVCAKVNANAVIDVFQSHPGRFAECQEFVASLRKLVQGWSGQGAASQQGAAAGQGDAGGAEGPHAGRLDHDPSGMSSACVGGEEIMREVDRVGARAQVQAGHGLCRVGRAFQAAMRYAHDFYRRCRTADPTGQNARETAAAIQAVEATIQQTCVE